MAPTTTALTRTYLASFTTEQVMDFAELVRKLTSVNGPYALSDADALALLDIVAAFPEPSEADQDAWLEARRAADPGRICW